MEDKNILRLEAGVAGELEGKTILEIGPGDGRLSEILLSKNPKKIYLVEKDSRFAAILREKFASEPKVEIIETDILELEFPKIDIVFGNIPYYISSEIVFGLKGLEIEQAILMVQKEFAQKMVQKSGNGNYGRLSVTSQIFFEVKMIRTVSKGLFRPMPKVDSAIISLRPTGIKLTQDQEDIIRYLFSHKNKTVRNALLDSKKISEKEIEKIGDYAKKRARTLNKEQVLEICRLISSDQKVF
ncbi:ribosomal RNA small subunit methyltransferase A [Candidatus Micrarchaeota archaeon]|nr:ribosomal RNA small subunit methyltransferase A [Candidatus Micrarchaeota archaeon]